MRYTCAKLISLKNLQIGKNYFPDLQEFLNKKILTINFIPNQKAPEIQAQDSSVEDGLYLSLTRDGQKYDYLNVPISEFSLTNCKGNNVEICRELLWQNCYIDCVSSNNVGKTAVFVVWYEYDKISMKDNGCNKSNYSNFDVRLVTGNGYKNFFDDNRDLFGKGFRGFVFDPSINISPNGNATYTNSKNVFITLVKGGYAVIDSIPLVVFEQLGNYSQICFDNIMFDFENSYLQVFDTQDNINKKCVTISCSYQR